MEQNEIDALGKYIAENAVPMNAADKTPTPDGVRVASLPEMLRVEAALEMFTNKQPQLMRDAANEIDEWKRQHENLLAMFRKSQDELAAKTAECEKWKRDWEQESGEHAEHIAQAKFELAAKAQKLAKAKAEAERLREAFHKTVGDSLEVMDSMIRGIHGDVDPENVMEMVRGYAERANKNNAETLPIIGERKMQP